MKTIIHQLSDLFRTAALRAFPHLPAEFPVEVAQSSQSKFGDYQFNSAMKLTKMTQKNPREIADTIAKEVEKTNSPLIGKIEIAGPGFINITLAPGFIETAINGVLHHPHLGVDLPEHPQRVVIDFSSPNTAKEMHVGHLRSTIIGDCLARLQEFLGHDVLRLNHVGDWGTAFGMLIAYMKTEVPKVLTGEVKSDLTELMNWYKASKARFDADPEFKKRSQLEVVALQGGNAESLKAWNIICEISRNAYQQIYDLLDIKIIERGESYYNPMLADTVSDLENKGLVQISGGARCVYIEGFVNREGESLPLIVQKSDGGYNYDTTDMAAMRHRVGVEHADRIIIVTDAGQAQHFAMIFKASEMAGYHDPKKVRTDHVPFGLVLGPDGKKFKTRSGETEKLIDLINAAIKHADDILKERSPDLKPDEREKLAKALGIGAVKYADLSCHRTGDYQFSYERMLRFEGNTAAFLMYSYVRVEGIKRKVGIDVEELVPTGKIALTHPSERELALHLLRFGESLEQVSNDLLPHRLTEYLYGLAERFNAFFRDCRVEGSAEQTSRLLLAELTAKVMRQGLEIIGVQVVEKM